MYNLLTVLSFDLEIEIQCVRSGHVQVGDPGEGGGGGLPAGDMRASQGTFSSLIKF